MTRKERDSLILQKYKEGLSTYAVGDIVGVSAFTVSKVLKDNGVPIRSKLRLTCEVRSAIYQDYQNGVNIKELCEKYKFDKSAIFGALRFFRGKAPQKRIPKEQYSLIAEDYSRGMTSYEVAGRYGISQSVALDIIRKEGVQPRSIRITEEQKQSIVKLYSEGMSAVKVAKVLNLAHPTVLMVCKEKGVFRTLSYLNGRQKDEIMRLFRSGKPNKEIAELMNVTLVQVQRTTKGLGKPKRYATTEQFEQICLMYRNGMSTIQISNDIGFTSGFISKHLRRLGVEIRPKEEVSLRMWQNDRYRSERLSTMKKSAKRGAASHFWKGGRTGLSMLIRTCAKYDEWRYAIYERDNHTCQICGVAKPPKSNPINADHIYPFSRILDDHDIKTFEEAMNCEKLWDISNGRCLCKSCHTKTPTWGRNIPKRSVKGTV